MPIGGISGGFDNFPGFRGVSGLQKPDFSEIQGRIQEKKAEAFTAANTDGEDGLTLEEFGELRADSPFSQAKNAGNIETADIFARFDSDGNGIVSEEEFVNRQPPGPASGLSSDTLAGLVSLQEDISTLIDLLEASDEPEEAAPVSEETSETDETSSEDAFIEALTGLVDGDNEAAGDLASQLLEILNSETV